MTTLTLQPDATDGLDTILFESLPTTNFGTFVTLNIGESATVANSRRRTLIKFDLSALPTNAIIYSATLSLWMLTDDASAASTIEVFRCKRAWVESEATWNIYSTGNNWQEAGGFGADDCEQTAIGSLALTASETTGEFKDITLTPKTKAGLDLGNGWLLKTSAELNDNYTYASSDGTTAAQRPKLTIVYATPYSAASAIRAAIEADGTLSSLATGGVYDFEETERLGLNRTTQPNIVDANGILKPTILVKSRSGIPDGILADDAIQYRTLRETVEVWLYDDDDYSTAIDSMRQRLYTVLHAQQHEGGFATYWVQDVRNARDEDLDAMVERSEFTVHTYRQLASFVGPYDAYTLEHAYGVRRLLSTYTGPLLRLREDSGDTEQDIGYLANGDIDAAAITTFLAGANGFVVTWYDQADAGDDITQSDSAKQPDYTTGVQNGRPGLYFDDVDNHLTGVWTSTLAQPYTSISVAQLDAASINDIRSHVIYDTSFGAGLAAVQANASYVPDSWSINAGSDVVGSATNANWLIWTVQMNGASSEFWHNQVSQASGDAGSGTMGGLTVGAFRSPVTAFWHGYITELVFGAKAWDATERAALEDIANAYWMVY